MRWIRYIFLIGVAVLVPMDRADVGKLQPIEVVVLEYEGPQLRIETDTEDVGLGATVTEALDDLKQSSSGIVLLDTAEYLLMEAGTEVYIQDMKDILKGNVRVCYVEGEKDLSKVSAYLNVHKPTMQLKDVPSGQIGEILTFENERIKINEIDEKST